MCGLAVSASIIMKPNLSSKALVFILDFFFSFLGLMKLKRQKYPRLQPSTNKTQSRFLFFFCDFFLFSSYSYDF